MTAFQRMSFEVEARRLISKARRVSRAAARNRGEAPRMSRTTIRLVQAGLLLVAVAGIVQDIYVARQFGWL